MTNLLTVTEPSKDIQREMHHVMIDLDAGDMQVGGPTIKASKELMTELKKCMDAELPKIEGYKSHVLTIAAAIK